MDAENLAPTGIQSLDHPALSESLYRMSYPSPHHFIMGKLHEQYEYNEGQISNQSVWFENFSDSIQQLWADVVCCGKLKVAKKIDPLVTITVLSINELTFQNEYLTPRGLYSNPGQTM